MLAFKNTEVTKTKLIESLKAHAEADRIRSGFGYWMHDRGCAVGCSIHDFAPGSESVHKMYEPLFGIPECIARLEDSIFEGLPSDQRKDWPLRFTQSIRIGADLSGVWDRFALWLLVDPEDGVIKFAKEGTKQREAIELVGRLFQRRIDRDNTTLQEWKDASAAASAASGAAYAAYAYAAASAAYAAYAYAYAASAYAYAYAASASAYAYAASAASDAYAASAASDAAYAAKQADKLIELLKAC